MWNLFKRFAIHSWNDLRSIVIVGFIFIMAILALLSWAGYVKGMFSAIIG